MLLGLPRFFALIGCVGLLALGVLAGAPIPALRAGGGLLALCCAMALTTPGVDVHRVVQTQRTDTLRSLQELTRLKAGADPVADAAWLLVLESMIFQAEAEVRWLDHCELRVGTLPARPATAGAAAPQEALR